MIMENTTAAAAAGMLMTIGVWDILDITFDRIKPAATPKTPPTLVSTAASVKN